MECRRPCVRVCSGARALRPVLPSVFPLFFPPPVFDLEFFSLLSLWQPCTLFFLPVCVFRRLVCGCEAGEGPERFSATARVCAACVLSTDPLGGSGGKKTGRALRWRAAKKKQSPHPPSSHPFPFSRSVCVFVRLVFFSPCSPFPRVFRSMFVRFFTVVQFLFLCRDRKKKKKKKRRWVALSLSSPHTIHPISLSSSHPRTPHTPRIHPPMPTIAVRVPGGRTFALDGAGGAAALRARVEAAHGERGGKKEG